VSFREPLFLLLLALLPAAVAAYLAQDRRRRRAAERFASPGLMPALAPARPGFRRHAPVLLYGLAVAAAVVALARPETTVAVDERSASLVLVTDISGSMQATDVAPTRLDAARAAALDLLDEAPRELQVGAVAFNHAVRAVQAPSEDRAAVRSLVDGLRFSGGTATGEALATALRLAERGRDDARSTSAILLLSDGESTHGRDPLPVAREARRLGVPVYTVALGTDQGTIEVERPDGSTALRPVPPDRATLEQIAELSGGRALRAADADTLSAAYERLGERVAKRDERREVSAAFAAGAVLVVLSGGLLSLRWFGRLP
jgi:Ca-activated chloride channel homolog